MNDAREEIFQSIRRALPQSALAPDLESDLPPAQVADIAPLACATRWRDELTALGGHVHGPVAAAEAPALVASIARSLGATALLAWGESSLRLPGLTAALASEHIECVRPAPDVDPREGRARFASMEVGLTGAVAGLADTGSVIVASGSAQPRSASLLPPTCIVVLHQTDLYADLPSWMALEGARRMPDTANLVIITGPSRTADIELSLVIGVHGPGVLHVVLAS